MRPHSEKYVEVYLRTETSRHGGMIRKVSWVNHVGAPDDVLMFDVATIWVECKAGGKAATKFQTREHDKMRAHGQRVEVINTREGVDALMREVVSMRQRLAA